MSDNMILFPILIDKDRFCQYLEKHNIEIVARTEIGVLILPEDKCLYELSNLREKYFIDEDQYDHASEIKRMVDKTMEKLKADRYFE